MRIVLDTKEETLQDLKDTVRMLQALIESRGGVSNINHNSDMFSSTPSGNQAAVAGLMSMFGDANAANSPQAQLQEGSNDPERFASDIKIIEY